MTNRTMTRQHGRDVGTGGVEVAFAVTALLLVAFFVTGALRTTNAGGDVAAAARAGARAAATARLFAPPTRTLASPTRCSL